MRVSYWRNRSRKMIMVEMYFVGIIVILLFASGCAQGENTLLPDLPAEGEGMLKVLYYDEQSFQEKYGNFFSKQFPRVQIHVISTKTLQEDSRHEQLEIEELTRLIEQENPDLIWLQDNHIVPLADKGMLQPLDVIIEQDQFDLTGIPDNTMDYFRQKGGGILYTLSPTYTTQAIYYNADLFKAHHIDLPRNQMTWEELFSLASRFSELGTKEEPVYGLSLHVPVTMMNLLNVAQTDSLRVIDARGERLQFDTEGWRRVFRLVAEAIKTGTLYTSGPEVTAKNLLENPFSQGRVAMTIKEPSMSSIRGSSTFEIGVVTMPVNPMQPDINPFLSYPDLFAIHQRSENKRLAWEMLSYMLSPEMAKTMAQGWAVRLPTRNGDLKQVGEWSAEPFTMLKPSLHGGPSYNIVERENFSESFKNELYGALVETLDEIVNNNRQVEEALASMQEELEVKLEQEKNK